VNGLEPLPEAMVESLAAAEGLPGDSSAQQGVEALQTHISHLFLTRERVYKLRKAVELSFLSFASRRARNADCLREVELNRRLAPEVYLGVAPILPRAGGGWQLGEPGEGLCDESGEPIATGGRAAEHCVVMRRLPDGRDALSMLEADRLEPHHIEVLAQRLVRFHREVHLGTPAPWSPDEWLARIEAPVETTFALAREAGEGVLDPGLLEAARGAMHAWVEAHRERLLRRREAGRAVDGHGDLHLAHVWYPDDTAPVVIDCIEFDPELRRIDVAAELAFFVMDAAYRGREDLGELLLARYAQASDDYDLYGVVDYHILHRALVRASVAAVASGETEVDSAQREAAALSAARHLEMVNERLERASRSLIVLTTGLSGTGKSTVATEAARLLGGVSIASDRVRKHQAGLRVSARAAAAPGEGLYTQDRTRAVYAGLLERADPVLRSGRPVVLDATYSLANQRDAVRGYAGGLGVPVLLLEVRCDEAVTLRRLEARLEDSERISDAGPGIYRSQKERYEPPDEWPEERRIVVDTGLEGWRGALQKVLREAEGESLGGLLESGRPRSEGAAGGPVHAPRGASRVR
jgi:aminoglycoside phosphotransferase family enzyme/predicted kinase